METLMVRAAILLVVLAVITIPVLTLLTAANFTLWLRTLLFR